MGLTWLFAPLNPIPLLERLPLSILGALSLCKRLCLARALVCCCRNGIHQRGAVFDRFAAYLHIEPPSQPLDDRRLTTLPTAVLAQPEPTPNFGLR